ncbi:nickel-binding protein [Terrarubrum flagellatum]|uniref:nickel-binding protein n=1 Tax=Terrirubrum flagellatum TaxID=2895980 RepID=UPI0031450686
MDLYVIRRPSAWASIEELELAGAKSARIGNEEMADRVRWIRSYVVHEADGRIGTVCIYEARDGESIREHARRVGMPGDDFQRVASTVIVRDDPSEVRIAAE